MVAVTSVAAVAASRVRSRDQAAADRDPPPRSVLTASVVHRVLVETVVARATVVAEANVAVPVPDLPEGSRPTVTAAPAGGTDELTEGAVAFEVAGRPVVVLVGAMPAYRSLEPGDAGDDVAQLQAALGRLGFATDDDVGTFGPGTADAVGALYGARGYEPIEHLAAGLTGRADAVDAVRAAEDDLVEAQASSEPGRTAEARRRLESARSSLAAIDATSGPSVPFGEVVFVPALPARIGETGAGVGGNVSDSLGTLFAGRLLFEARIDPEVSDRLAVGQQATLHDDAAGSSLEATVASIGPTETDPDTSTVLRRVRLAPATIVEPDLLGRDLRVTLQGTSTDDRVLVVPVAAITNGPDAGPRVERMEPSGAIRSVAVTVGMIADGYAEVDPASRLRPGDEVVVGR